MASEWLHTIDGEGLTPLDRAFNSGHMVVAELLLRQERMDEAEKAGDDDSQPLYRAAYFGLHRAVKCLLDHTDPDQRDRHGETPLHKAVRGGSTETIALLTEVCDVNAESGDGMTALHWSALRGDLETAEILCEAGADPHMRNESLDGLSPRELASQMGYEELAVYLERREAFV